jgi:hypothetical protein
MLADGHRPRRRHACALSKADSRLELESVVPAKPQKCDG